MQARRPHAARDAPRHAGSSAWCGARIADRARARGPPPAGRRGSAGDASASLAVISRGPHAPGGSILPPPGQFAVAPALSRNEPGERFPRRVGDRFRPHRRARDEDMHEMALRRRLVLLVAEDRELVAHARASEMADAEADRDEIRRCPAGRFARRGQEAAFYPGRTAGNRQPCARGSHRSLERCA